MKKSRTGLKKINKHNGYRNIQMTIYQKSQSVYGHTSIILTDNEFFLKASN